MPQFYIFARLQYTGIGFTKQTSSAQAQEGGDLLHPGSRLGDLSSCPGADGPALERTNLMSQTSQESKTFMQKLLDGVERVGNKVPHPAVIFLMLIGIVVVLSQLLYLLGTSVTY